MLEKRGRRWPLIWQTESVVMPHDRRGLETRSYWKMEQGGQILKSLSGKKEGPKGGGGHGKNLPKKHWHSFPKRNTTDFFGGGKGVCLGFRQRRVQGPRGRGFRVFFVVLLCCCYTRREMTRV